MDRKRPCTSARTFGAPARAAHRVITPRCFEIGHVALATQLYHEGLVEAPPFYQFALGIPWGAALGAANSRGS